MPSPISRLLLLLLLTGLASCWLGPLPPSTPSQQSKYSLDLFFKDPKAQALAVAAERGDAQEVRRLMKEGVNPDRYFSKQGHPLLIWPIYTHNPEGLRAMLENGADPNVAKPYPPEKGRSPSNVSNAMVWAAEQEDPIYLKLLLDHGGDPNTRNANNETLLFHAFIKQNQKQNVKLLVERGAEVNGLAGMGSSILHSYASRGGFEMVYWLLLHGADPSENYLTKQPLPPAPPRSHIIESIYWYPPHPLARGWQRNCQQWLLKHGYQRPTLPDVYRSMRKDLGFPYEEKDIPLL